MFICLEMVHNGLVTLRSLDTSLEERKGAPPGPEGPPGTDPRLPSFTAAAAFVSAPTMRRFSQERKKSNVLLKHTHTHQVAGSHFIGAARAIIAGYNLDF